MTIKQFIEKAIEGGWKTNLMTCSHGVFDGSIGEFGGHLDGEELHFIFLDPKAWQAVGKVEGWGREYVGNSIAPSNDWRGRMHQMIDALAEGKSLKEFLKTL